MSEKQKVYVLYAEVLLKQVLRSAKDAEQEAKNITKNTRRGKMNKVLQSRFYTAREVSQIMDCSVPTAYKIIAQMNKKLNEMGKFTLPGKISKVFFDEHI